MLFRKVVHLKIDRPLISFSFDDFPKTALIIGGSILNHFGLAGTYYASLGLIGREELTGRMFEAEDLKLLIDRGHELGCHTFSHSHAGDTPPEAFEEEIIKNGKALRELLPAVQFRTFSYPISLPRPLNKLRTGRHFLCCRGGDQKFNFGVADLNNLSAYFLEKSRDRIDDIKLLIDENHAAKGWLIFATHDISDSPTPYGCTPEFFEEVVQYAIASGSRILPVVEALEAAAGGDGVVVHGRRR